MFYEILEMIMHTADIVAAAWIHPANAICKGLSLVCMHARSRCNGLVCVYGDIE